MPPTDKALAVMTGEHLAIMQDVQCVYRSSVSLELLRDIESVVRYLVDHPERLAGEDEVVVKRRQLVALEVELRDFLSIAPSARAYVLRRMHDAVAGWLAGSPTAQESK